MVETEAELVSEAPEGGMQVDADGNPIQPQDPAYGDPFPDTPAPPAGRPPPSREVVRPRLDEQQLDQEWIDRASKGRRELESEEPPETVEPRPLAA
jgi:penicillin-binding protein 1A